MGRKFSAYVFLKIGKLFRSKKIIKQNIINALGNISDSEIENIMESMWRNYGFTFAEYIYLRKYRLNKFSEHLVDNNFEITQDSLPLNSSATEILIGNEDCVVELDPSNKNNLEIENTAKSDEKGVMVGDYAIVKEKGEKFRKDDNMDLPRLEQKIDRQAF